MSARRLVAELARSLPLLARQLRRSPRRTALTFLGLAIAFFLFTSLESVLYTMGQVVQGTAGDALLFMRPAEREGHWLPRLPARYADGLESVPGVVAAAPVRFHVGAGAREGSYAVAVGIEPDAHLAMGLPAGVSGDELRAFFAERRAALVGERLLEDSGWEVGDRVTIAGREGAGGLDFEIVGDIARGDRLDRVAVVSLDYLEDVLGGAGRVTYVQIRVRDALIAPAVAEALDARFAHAAVATETVTEKAHLAPFVGGLADAMAGLRAVGLLALGVTLLVVANSVAIGVRERTREIGTLRALGFGRGRVLALVMGEAVAVAIAGGAAGAAAAWAVFASGSVAIPGAGFAFATDASVVLRSALLAVPLGLLAGTPPGLGAVRIPITDALRHSD